MPFFYLLNNSELFVWGSFTLIVAIFLNVLPCKTLETAIWSPFLYSIRNVQYGGQQSNVT